MNQTAFFRPQTADMTSRTVELCLSTGARVLQRDGTQAFTEVAPIL